MSWSPWTLPGLVNRAPEREKSPKSPPASPSWRGQGAVHVQLGDWGVGSAWTGQDLFLPRAPWSRRPPETRNTQPTPEQGFPESVLAPQSPFPNLGPSSAPVGLGRRPLKNPGFRISKESRQQSVSLARSTSGPGFHPSGGVRYAHSQEVTVFLTCQVEQTGAGEGEGEGRHGWPPGF